MRVFIDGVSLGGYEWAADPKRVDAPTPENLTRFGAVLGDLYDAIHKGFRFGWLADDTTRWWVEDEHVFHLVTLAGCMDDLPVGLFKDRKDAIDFMMKEQPAPVDGDDYATEGALHLAASTAGRGPSCVYGYSLWTFMKGVVIHEQQLRWLDEWPGPQAYAAMTVEQKAELQRQTAIV